MTAKLLGENVVFQIEVEQDAVLLVFDRKCSSALVPWEDAYDLAVLMEKVVEDVRNDFKPTGIATTMREQRQVELNHGKGLVAIFVEWADRVRYTSLDAFYLTAQAIKKTAQDAQYAQRGVHFLYQSGTNLLSKIHNTRTDVTQYVR